MIYVTENIPLIYKKIKYNIKKVIAVMLCLSIMITCVNIIAYATGGVNRLGDWSVQTLWDNYDTMNYVVTSSTDETIRPKMVFKYYAAKATADYAPGDVKITIDGIDDIGRATMISAKTTTNSNDSKWDLIESETGKYVFANRNQINREDSLSGGFEIMWEFSSREAKNGYSKAITPVFSVKNSGGTYDSINLPDLKFSYYSERDWYILNVDTDKIKSEEYERVAGIGNSGETTKYENYTWYSNTIRFNPQTKARGANISDFFVAIKVVDISTGNEIPQSYYSEITVLKENGARVNTLGLYDLDSITGLASDKGRKVFGYYEFQDKRGDLSNDEYIFYVGYPSKNNDGTHDGRFDAKGITTAGYLNILYYDDDDYVRLSSGTLDKEKIEDDDYQENHSYSFSYRGSTYGHYKNNGTYEKSDHTMPPNSRKLLSSEIYNDKIVYYNLVLVAHRQYTESGTDYENGTVSYGSTSLSSSSTGNGLLKSKSTSTGTDTIVDTGSRTRGANLVVGDDRLAIELEQGQLRRLEKEEYDIASVTITKDEYNTSYEVYATETPDLDYDNVKTSGDTKEAYVLVGTGNTTVDKSFNFPKNKYCSFFIKMKDIKGEYLKNIKVGIRFHVSDEITYTDNSGNTVTYPPINPEGKIANFSFFRVFRVDDDGNERYSMTILDTDYVGDYAYDVIRLDDHKYQNENIYRMYSNVYLREPETRLTSNTVISNGQDNSEFVKAIDTVYGGGYTFPVTSGGTISSDSTGSLNKFSIHTLLPEELKPRDDLSEVRYGSGSDDVIPGVTLEGYATDIDGNIIQNEELEDYVRYEVTQRDDGMTVVSAFFDFTEFPLQISSLTNVKMTYPVIVDMVSYKSGTKDYTVESFTSIQDKGTKKIKGDYIQSDVHNIDNDPDTELVAKSYDKLIGKQNISQWQNKAYKNVKTYLSGGYKSAEVNVALGIDNHVMAFAKTEENAPADEKTSYSYRLEMEIGEEISSIIMYDNIEPSAAEYNGTYVNSKWHGTVQSVDTSFLMSVAGLDCTVFYSENENEPYSGISKTGTITSGEWHKMNTNAVKTLWTPPQNKDVRSIAIFIDTSNLSGGVISKSILYAVVNMLTPTYPDTEQENYIAQNMYTLKYSSNSSQIQSELYSSVTNVELLENLPIVSFRKIDVNNKRALKGASFQIFIDKNDNGVCDSGEFVDEGTTNNFGKWTTYKMKYGVVYSLYETTPPDGYNTIENPRKIMLTHDSTSGVAVVTLSSEVRNITETNKDEFVIDVEDERINGTVNVLKKDANGGISGNIKGASFELYKSNGTQVFLLQQNEEDISEAEKGKNVYVYDENAVDVTGVFYTAENGFVLKELPWGNYYIQEVEAPKGFLVNSKATKFSITSKQTTLNINKPDEEQTASLRLKKFADTGDLLQNAKYKLERWDTTTKTWKTSVNYLSTDNAGIIEVENLKFGQYRFVEINAPIGYDMKGITDKDNAAKSPRIEDLKVVSDNPTIDVLKYVNRTTGTITLNENTAGLMIQVNDINIHKTGKATIIKTKTDDTPLQGAKFNLYMVVDGGEDQLIRSGLVTGSDGRITAVSGDDLGDGMYGVKDLEWGKYYFQETYAPTGYQLDTSKIEFEITPQNVDITAELTAINTQKTGSVILVKKAESNTTVNGTTITKDSPLADAVFSLYTKDGGLVNVKKLADGIYTVSSNSSENTESRMTTVSANSAYNGISITKGQIYIDNLSWGSYYLEEKQAPSGFVVADKVRFSVNANTCSAVQELECYDKAMECEIIINKQVNDIVDSFGTPVFMFKVTNTADSSKSYIKSITVDKLSKSGAISFSVPVGTYKVEEITVARYTLKSASKTAGGRTQYATVTQNSDKTLNCIFSGTAAGKGIAEVTFVNELTNYDYVGHNSIVTNIIPKGRKVTGLSLEYPDIVPVLENSTGYTVRAEDMIGYLIYDDGEKSDTPLTETELKTIVFTPLDGLPVLTVRNGVNDANSIQTLSASYTTGGRTLKTTVDITIGSLKTSIVQKIIFNIDADNNCYFLKNNKRAISNVIYMVDGQIVSGTYIIPTSIDSDNTKSISWSREQYGITASEVKWEDVQKYISKRPNLKEIVFYAKLGKLVVNFGDEPSGEIPDDGGSYADDPDNPYADPEDEKEEKPDDWDDNVEQWVVPVDGYYYLEAWGASGGDYLTVEGAEIDDYANRTLENHGGHGGYSYSVSYLTAGTVLYIYTGKKGINSHETNETITIPGGWNGGGNGGNASGGGMSYISLTYNPVSKVDFENGETWDSTGTLIVAGGGGGAGTNGSGGYGVAELTSGISGKGSNAVNTTSGGGGGGWYGGTAGSGTNGGNGGSGYTAEGTVSADGQTAVMMINNILTGDELVPTYDGAVLDQSTQTMIGNIGNGHVRISLIEDEIPVKYSGKAQTFVAQQSGYYFLEGWGAAAGGSIGDGTFTRDTAGKGAYTSGYLYLEKGEEIYIYVGGQGGDATLPPNGRNGSRPTEYSAGGWNGGGAADHDHSDDEVGAGGGGATDFRLVKDSTSDYNWNNFDSLKSRIMVAGAGGGASYRFDTHGGDGGKLEGLKAITADNTVSEAKPGTQTDGYKFGEGETYTHLVANCDSGGGGGGYYGGGVKEYKNRYTDTGAAGGSSFISGYPGCNAVAESSVSNNIVHTGQSIHYSGYQFIEPVMIAGNEEMPSFEGAYGIEDGAETMTGNAGSGYAQITFVGIVDQFNYGYTGEQQIFTAPVSGYYKLQTWGASGGDGYTTYSEHCNTTISSHGGHGGYSEADVYLEAGTQIYIYVGGEGKYGVKATVGGYNGGGNSGWNYTNKSGSGGGMTHISTTKNPAVMTQVTTTHPKMTNYTYNSYTSWNPTGTLLVAGGGGGADDASSSSSIYYLAGKDNDGSGGYGGGLIGGAAYSEGSLASAGEAGYGGMQSADILVGNIQGCGKGGTLNTDMGGGGGGWYGGTSGSRVVLNNEGKPVRKGGGGSGGSGHICEGSVSAVTRNGTTVNAVVVSGETIGGNLTVPTYENAVMDPSTGKMIGNIGNGHAAISYISSPNEVDYQYSGGVQSFVAPKSGRYKVELWGAGERSEKAGGAYTSGEIYLSEMSQLYLYIGEKGNNNSSERFNGAGKLLNPANDGNNANGGGATDVRLVKDTESSDGWSGFDSLKSRIMVAGGAGGYVGAGGFETAILGNAGTLESSAAQWTSQSYATSHNLTWHHVNGATQTSGYSFGKGESGNRASGGGGYYGGYARSVLNAATSFIGSGGTSFISGYDGCVAITEDSTVDNIIHKNEEDPNRSVHYSGYVFENAEMIAGGNNNMPSHSNTRSASQNAVVNGGHGYARITYIGES